MTDLAADGDGLQRLATLRLAAASKEWVRADLLAETLDRLDTALRERDALTLRLGARSTAAEETLLAVINEVEAERDALRVRAETAEADADRLAAAAEWHGTCAMCQEALATHAAAVEGRP